MSSFDKDEDPYDLFSHLGFDIKLVGTKGFVIMTIVAVAVFVFVLVNLL